jgi:glycosyltransferase involved in cell wall biosynthesis
MKKLKIAHVCPFYSPAIGGVKQVVEELAKRQLKEGHEVHVYTSDWDKDKRIAKKEEVIEGIRVHRCKYIAKLTQFVSLWPSVLGKLTRGKFDVIHSHVFGHPHFFFSQLAARKSGAKHVHTTHCPWTDAHRSFIGDLGIKISYNTFSKWAFGKVDKIIAITPWEVEFIKKYGGSEDKIEVLPNGMTELFFKKFKNNDFKEKHGISGKLVLFFGRLNVTKGPEKFVDMAHSILRERKDVTFFMRGPDEGMLSEIKKRIGKEKRIILKGPDRNRESIVKMYQAADVFVLPSYREGLPLTLFEAMAAGLPVVASPCNGIPYEMKEPENGFLVKYGDVETLKKRVNQLLYDPKLRSKISKNNLKKAAEYKWDIIAGKTLRIYKDLLRT